MAMCVLFVTYFSSGTWFVVLWTCYIGHCYFNWIPSLILFKVNVLVLLI